MVNVGLEDEHFLILQHEWSRDNPIENYPSIQDVEDQPERWFCSPRDSRFPLSTEENHLHPDQSHSMLGFRVVLPEAAFPVIQSDGETVKELLGELQSKDRIRVWEGRRKLVGVASRQRMLCLNCSNW
jgi:hypothetical protein